MAVGDPTGADLTFGTTNGNTLPEPYPPTEPEEREITFGSPIELTSGVKYAIVARSTVSGAANTVLWQMKASGGGYASGAQYYSQDSNSSWSVNGTADAWFETYATGVKKDDYTFAFTGAGAWVRSDFWSAQTFIASSTYTISSVKLRLYRASGATPGTLTISIKATEGVPSKATTPAPTDAAADVTLDQATLTWEDGGGADTYNVYYGTTSGSLSLVSEGQAGKSLIVTGITNGSPYGYEVTRYWRIDSINAAGTTTGDEWSFTTIVFDQLKTSYMLIPGGNGSGPYDSPPGAEGTDWRYTGENAMTHVERLVAAANNKIWYEQK